MSDLQDSLLSDYNDELKAYAIRRKETSDRRDQVADLEADARGREGDGRRQARRGQGPPRQARGRGARGDPLPRQRRPGPASASRPRAARPRPCSTPWRRSATPTSTAPPARRLRLLRPDDDGLGAGRRLAAALVERPVRHPAPHISDSQLQPGDLVFYYSPISHVGDVHRQRHDRARRQPRRRRPGEPLCTPCRTSARSALADRATRRGRPSPLVGGRCSRCRGPARPAASPTSRTSRRRPTASSDAVDRRRRATDRSTGSSAPCGAMTPTPRPTLGADADAGRPAPLDRRTPRAPSTRRRDLPLRRENGRITPDGSLDGRGRDHLADRRVRRRPGAGARSSSRSPTAASGSPRSAAAWDVTPVWLTGPATVRRTADIVVLVAGGALPVRPLVAEARAGAACVARRVLGSRPGRLVVEVPGVRRRPGRRPRAADPGRTTPWPRSPTSADGANVPGHARSTSSSTPTSSADSSPLAAQVVISHEAVHVADRARRQSGADSWLLEGFADYVALRDVDLPLSRTAGQIIAQVRRTRRSRRSCRARPTSTPGAAHLGAAYEACWLACVTLAEHGGEEALVALYDAVDGGADLDAELRSQFGWTIADLTRRVAGSRSCQTWLREPAERDRTPGRARSRPSSASPRSCCSPPGWCRGTRSRAGRPTRSPPTGLHAEQIQRAEDYARWAGSGAGLARRVARRGLLARLRRGRPAARRPAAAAGGGCGWSWPSPR